MSNDYWTQLDRDYLEYLILTQKALGHSERSGARFAASKLERSFASVHRFWQALKQNPKWRPSDRTRRTMRTIKSNETRRLARDYSESPVPALRQRALLQPNGKGAGKGTDSGIHRMESSRRLGNQKPKTSSRHGAGDARIHL